MQNRIFNEAFELITDPDFAYVCWMDELYKPVLSFQSLYDPECRIHVLNCDGEYSLIASLEKLGEYQSIDVIPATVFKHLRELPLPEGGVLS